MLRLLVVVLCLGVAAATSSAPCCPSCPDLFHGRCPAVNEMYGPYYPKGGECVEACPGSYVSVCLCLFVFVFVCVHVHLRDVCVVLRPHRLMTCWWLSVGRVGCRLLVSSVLLHPQLLEDAEHWVRVRVGAVRP